MRWQMVDTSKGSSTSNICNISNFTGWAMVFKIFAAACSFLLILYAWLLSSLQIYEHSNEYSIIFIVFIFLKIL